MKAIRRGLLIILALVFSLALFSCEEANEGLNYQKTEDGKGYTVVKYIGEEKILEIPEEYNGLPVVAIEPYAFSGRDKLETLYIPESVETIGEYAFFQCNKLLDATIPSGVKSIGEKAFAGCEYLTYIYIPDTLESIGKGAFSNCTRIAEIHVDKDNAKYHNDGNCLIETESKTLVLGCKASVIPDDASVTSIGYAAFDGCTALKTITIPKAVIKIDEYAFNNCRGLEAVYYDGTTAEWNAIEIGDYNYQFEATIRHYVSE